MTNCTATCALNAVGIHYGEDKVPLDQPIPAHLLGNMWSQTWGNIYDLLEPYPDAPTLDVTADPGCRRLSTHRKTWCVRQRASMYRLDFDPLPDTFWERSQFTKPRDREVQCHASAWGLDGGNDLRIKMCIKQTYEELKCDLSRAWPQRTTSAHTRISHLLFQWCRTRRASTRRSVTPIVLAMTPGVPAKKLGSIEETLCPTTKR